MPDWGVAEEVETVISVIPLAVMAVVSPIGLVMPQERVTVQLLPFKAIVQEGDAGPRVPDMDSAPVVNVPSGEYPVPVTLIA